MGNLPVNAKTLEEALQLSEEILTSIELETTSLSSCMLKVSRLARLLNDFEYQQIFRYEIGGYPSASKNVDKEIWQLYIKANRVYKEVVDKETKEKVSSLSVIYQEERLIALRNLLELEVGTDVHASRNRNQLGQYIFEVLRFLTKRKSFLHEYVSTKYYELKYAKTSTDIFSRTRLIVDENIGKIIPEAAHKFASIYDNLNSENTEGWSNAVHSCRRILQEMADVIYPPREDKVIKGKPIKLGAENYINRLMAYVEEHADSETFENIVGSNLSYLGERLDAIYKAANKGSHEIITTKEEADRYVIYTYLIIGDILSLN